MRHLRPLLIVLALMMVPAVALAAKPATGRQKTALLRAFGDSPTPAHCLTALVSTANRSWGEVYFTGLWGAHQRMPRGCEKYAANGVTIFHVRHGRWHMVTSGSSFVSNGGRCRVPGVPKAVVKDFRLCGSLSG